MKILADGEYPCDCGYETCETQLVVSRNGNLIGILDPNGVGFSVNFVLPDGVRLCWEGEDAPAPERRTIVCLCGSTRFSEAYQRANIEETVAGRIVLTIGCDMRSDAELFAGKSVEELAALKDGLDALHLDKIAMADEVFILNVGKYVGESTQRELDYARKLGKRVRFLEPEVKP